MFGPLSERIVVENTRIQAQDILRVLSGKIIKIKSALNFLLAVIL